MKREFTVPADLISADRLKGTAMLNEILQTVLLFIASLSSSFALIVSLKGYGITKHHLEYLNTLYDDPSTDETTRTLIDSYIPVNTLALRNQRISIILSVGLCMLVIMYAIKTILML